MNRTAAPAIQIALPLEFVHRTLVHRTLADVLLAAEANLLLFIFRACLTFIPLRHILRAFTRNRHTAPSTPAMPAPMRSIAHALRIRWAVEAVTRNSTATFVCLPQALAGYTMLRLRRVPTTMVYGVGRSPAGELIAHTWLTLDGRTVLGGEGSAAFTPINQWI